MIVRFQRCIGFRLLRLLRWQVELWWCPRGAVIPAHCHQQFDGRLVFMGGAMRWTMGGSSRLVGWGDLFRQWVVPIGVRHAAEVTGSFGMFINIERWSGNPTSAAQDFVEVP